MSFTLEQITNTTTKILWDYDPTELANIDGFDVKVDGVVKRHIIGHATEAFTNSLGITADGTYIISIVPYNGVGDGPGVDLTLVVAAVVPLAPTVAPTNPRIVL